MACILGINISHTGAACLVSSGRILAAVAEERLSRLKGDAGFPKLAVQSVLTSAGVQPQEIDTLAIGTLCERFEPRKAQAEEYRPLIRAASLASQVLPLSLLGSQPALSIYRAITSYLRRREARSEQIPWLNELGIRPHRVRFFDHHRCHAAAAYYLRPFSGSAAVLTCDGLGDGLAATVSIGSGNTLRLVAATPSVHSLGSMYSRVTRALGLKPWEHEGKVMGLAPYASAERAAPLARDFLRFIEIDGLKFCNRSGLIGDAFLNHITRRYGRHRFDDIAYAIQFLAETRLREWAEAALRSTGERHLCAAGGVFLNVKANSAIAESPMVTEAFFLPAPGDESVALGAALLAEAEDAPNAFPGTRYGTPVGTACWGPRIDEDRHQALQRLNPSRYRVRHLRHSINEQIARRLASGGIVARASGRLEFGPRALGNRSILADPTRVENIDILNQAVKNRDFWMPFAPAIAAEHASRYLRINGRISSPHMMRAFATRTSHRHEIQAAIHRADSTARPQIVEADLFPQLHEIIGIFHQLRGVGAVLNTSLNLHGHPLVCSAADALQVLEHSGLRYLALDDYWIEKLDPAITALGQDRSGSRELELPVRPA
jgi:carbamoyltransferase